MNYNQFTSESRDDDQNISIGAPPPQVHIIPQQQMYVPQQQMYVPQQQVYVPQQPHVNILEGPGYRLYSAQKSVRRWTTILSIFACLLLIWGILVIFFSICGLLLINQDDFKIEIEGPSNEQEEVEVDLDGIYANKSLDICHGFLYLILGAYILKTLYDPTRKSSWRLFKFCALLIFTRFVILGFQFIIIFGTFGDALDDMNEGHEAGNYTIKSKQGYEYKHKNNRKQYMEERERKFDEELAEGYSAFILMTIITMFAILFCILSCCAMCTLGFTYKLHDATKELDMVQTQLPSPIPNVSVSTSQIGNSVYRGQIVNMPVPNIQ